MADAIIDIMMHTGMFTTKAISSASTKSAPGNNPRAYNMPKARVAPTGAEKTALKMMASRTDASRTRPDDCRTKIDEDCLDVSIVVLLRWIAVKTCLSCPSGRRVTQEHVEGNPTRRRKYKIRSARLDMR